MAGLHIGRGLGPCSTPGVPTEYRSVPRSDLSKTLHFPDPCSVLDGQATAWKSFGQANKHGQQVRHAHHRHYLAVGYSASPALHSECYIPAAVSIRDSSPVDDGAVRYG